MFERNAVKIRWTEIIMIFITINKYKYKEVNFFPEIYQTLRQVSAVLSLNIKLLNLKINLRLGIRTWNFTSVSNH